jgi:hypothetical protein
MQKSVIDEIKELKAQVESKTEQAKAEALESGREAINFLRELGIDNDTILKELGFRARTKSPRERAAERKARTKSRARYATSKQTLPTTVDRIAANRRRSLSRPKSSKKKS